MKRINLVQNQFNSWFSYDIDQVDGSLTEVGADTKSNLIKHTHKEYSGESDAGSVEAYYILDIDEFNQCMDEAFRQGRIDYQDKGLYLSKAKQFIKWHQDIVYQEQHQKENTRPNYDESTGDDFSEVIYRDKDHVLGVRKSQKCILHKGRVYGLAYHGYEPCTYVNGGTIHNAFNISDVFDLFREGKNDTAITGIEYDPALFCKLIGYVIDYPDDYNIDDVEIKIGIREPRKKKREPIVISPEKQAELDLIHAKREACREQYKNDTWEDVLQDIIKKNVWEYGPIVWGLLIFKIEITTRTEAFNYNRDKSFKGHVCVKDNVLYLEDFNTRDSFNSNANTRIIDNEDYKRLVLIAEKHKSIDHKEANKLLAWIFKPEVEKSLSPDDLRSSDPTMNKNGIDIYLEQLADVESGTLYIDTFGNLKIIRKEHSFSERSSEINDASVWETIGPDSKHESKDDVSCCSVEEAKELLKELKEPFWIKFCTQLIDSIHTDRVIWENDKIKLEQSNGMTVFWFEGARYILTHCDKPNGSSGKLHIQSENGFHIWISQFYGMGSHKSLAMVEQGFSMKFNSKEIKDLLDDNNDVECEENNSKDKIEPKPEKLKKLFDEGCTIKDICNWTAMAIRMKAKIPQASGFNFLTVYEEYLTYQDPLYYSHHAYDNVAGHAPYTPPTDKEPKEETAKFFNEKGSLDLSIPWEDYDEWFQFEIKIPYKCREYTKDEIKRGSVGSTKGDAKYILFVDCEKNDLHDIHRNIDAHILELEDLTILLYAEQHNDISRKQTNRYIKHALEIHDKKCRWKIYWYKLTLGIYDYPKHRKCFIDKYERNIKDLEGTPDLTEEMTGTYKEMIKYADKQKEYYHYSRYCFCQVMDSTSTTCGYPSLPEQENDGIYNRYEDDPKEYHKVNRYRIYWYSNGQECRDGTPTLTEDMTGTRDEVIAYAEKQQHLYHYQGYQFQQISNKPQQVTTQQKGTGPASRYIINWYKSNVYKDGQEGQEIYDSKPSITKEFTGTEEEVIAYAKRKEEIYHSYWYDFYKISDDSQSKHSTELTRDQTEQTRGQTQKDTLTLDVAKIISSKLDNPDISLPRKQYEEIFKFDITVSCNGKEISYHGSVGKDKDSQNSYLLVNRYKNKMRDMDGIIQANALEDKEFKAIYRYAEEHDYIHQVMQPTTVQANLSEHRNNQLTKEEQAPLPNFNHQKENIYTDDVAWIISIKSDNPAMTIPRIKFEEWFKFDISIPRQNDHQKTPYHGSVGTDRDSQNVIYLVDRYNNNMRDWDGTITVNILDTNEFKHIINYAEQHHYVSRKDTNRYLRYALNMTGVHAQSKENAAAPSPCMESERLHGENPVEGFVDQISSTLSRIKDKCASFLSFSSSSLKGDAEDQFNKPAVQVPSSNESTTRHSVVLHRERLLRFDNQLRGKQYGKESFNIIDIDTYGDFCLEKFYKNNDTSYISTTIDKVKAIIHDLIYYHPKWYDFYSTMLHRLKTDWVYWENERTKLEQNNGMVYFWLDGKRYILSSEDDQGCRYVLKDEDSAGRAIEKRMDMELDRTSTSKLYIQSEDGFCTVIHGFFSIRKTLAMINQGYPVGYFTRSFGCYCPEYQDAIGQYDTTPCDISDICLWMAKAIVIKQKDPSRDGITFEELVTGRKTEQTPSPKNFDLSPKSPHTKERVENQKPQTDDSLAKAFMSIVSATSSRYDHEMFILRNQYEEWFKFDTSQGNGQSGKQSYHGSVGICPSKNAIMIVDTYHNIYMTYQEGEIEVDILTFDEFKIILSYLENTNKLSSKKANRFLKKAMDMSNRLVSPKRPLTISNNTMSPSPSKNTLSPSPSTESLSDVIKIFYSTMHITEGYFDEWFKCSDTISVGVSKRPNKALILVSREWMNYNRNEGDYIEARIISLDVFKQVVSYAEKNHIISHDSGVQMINRATLLDEARNNKELLFNISYYNNGRNAGGRVTIDTFGQVLINDEPGTKEKIETLISENHPCWEQFYKKLIDSLDTDKVYFSNNRVKLEQNDRMIYFWLDGKRYILGSKDNHGAEYVMEEVQDNYNTRLLYPRRISSSAGVYGRGLSIRSEDGFSSFISGFFPLRKTLAMFDQGLAVKYKNNTFICYCPEDQDNLDKDYTPCSLSDFCYWIAKAIVMKDRNPSANDFTFEEIVKACSSHKTS